MGVCASTGLIMMSSIALIKPRRASAASGEWRKGGVVSRSCISSARVAHACERAIGTLLPKRDDSAPPGISCAPFRKLWEDVGGRAQPTCKPGSLGGASCTRPSRLPLSSPDRHGSRGRCFGEPRLACRSLRAWCEGPCWTPGVICTVV